MNLQHAILSHEPLFRLGVFLAVFSLVAFSEFLSPRRVLQLSRQKRWFGNIMIHLTNTAALRLLLPLLPVGAALACAERGWGLFHLLAVPIWISGLAGIAVLDLVIYAQHVLFHRIRLLWRLHRMHHIDGDLDVTTAVRFHPVEILLSAFIKIAVIALLGPPAFAVLIFEVLLNGMSLFNHGNIRLPEALDRLIRLFIVTPDMHRVHHSIVMKESNHNYGFNIPWWDRLFGTYQAQPEEGHLNMRIGLEGFGDPRYLTVLSMLAVPFLSRKRNDA